MHACVNIGLGDDQQPRLLQERHDFRRNLEQFVAALEHAQLARPHDAEPALEYGLQRRTVDRVVAHAEECEIVGQQPAQKLDRFGDFIHRQRRRIGFKFFDDVVDVIEHRPPVFHGEPHFTQNALDRGNQFGARGRFDRFDMNMDEALARGAGGVRRAERDQFAALAPHAQNRMRYQENREPPVGDLAHHRVDQKRHVVVDDLNHRNRLERAGSREAHGLAADFRGARLAIADKVVSPLGERGEIVGAIVHHVFRHRACKDLRDETRRDAAAAGGQRDPGIFDDRLRGRIVVAGNTLKHGNLAV